MHILLLYTFKYFVPTWQCDFVNWIDNFITLNFTMYTQYLWSTCFVHSQALHTPYSCIGHSTPAPMMGLDAHRENTWWVLTAAGRGQGTTAPSPSPLSLGFEDTVAAHQCSSPSHQLVDCIGWLQLGRALMEGRETYNRNTDIEWCHTTFDTWLYCHRPIKQYKYKHRLASILTC